MTTATRHTISAILRPAVPLLWMAGYLVIALHWASVSGPSITSSLGAALVAFGGLFGLTGAYLALTQLVLQSRLPILELPFGRAALVSFHRKNGYAVILVLLTHATLVLIGYALENKVSLISQDITFLTSFPYVLWSSIALSLLVLVVALSITIVRRHLKYESWYFVHLLTYGAIVLAFFHQLSVGVEFLGQNVQGWRDYWWALYIFTFGSLIIFRFGRPVYLLLKYQFRIERIVPEANGIHSIYITGRHLDQLHYLPGQFMIWRFLDTERFWQAHPFSISQAPNGTTLRLTFKASGDFTSALAQIKPGTRVLIDGPYGDFTLAEEPNPKLLFIAGGIGLTPLRAMIEGLPKNSQPELIYAARTRADLALTSELEHLKTTTGLRVHYILSDETKPGYEHGKLEATLLTKLVPDYTERAVYLCGPPPMMRGVATMLTDAKVDPDVINTERFAF